MMNKALIYLLFFLSADLNAAEIYIHYPPPPKKPAPTSFVEFQVIDNSLKLDNSNIEKAAIAYSTINGQYIGLEVTIKPHFISEFERITENAVGKKMNLVMNKKIVAITLVQSALGRKFLITSLPRDEAYAFLQTLDYFKHHRA